jgi:hypothetical protein
MSSSEVDTKESKEEVSVETTKQTSSSCCVVVRSLDALKTLASESDTKSEEKVRFIIVP